MTSRNTLLLFTDCVNIEDDIDCEMWAMEGDCVNNSVWMNNNCRKACTKCGETYPPGNTNMMLKL